MSLPEVTGASVDITIEQVVAEDQASILALGEAVNEQYVVPLLNSQGQKAIRESRKADIKQVTNRDIYAALKAVSGGAIVGYIAWRQGHYIAQLYVESAYQNQGIGKALVTEMQRVSGAMRIQLKASVNALGFYQRLGFQASAPEQSKNGIRYVPMQLEVKPAR